MRTSIRVPTRSNALLSARPRPAGCDPFGGGGGLVDALAGVRKAGNPSAWDAFQATLDTTADPRFAERGARAERAFRRWASARGSEAAGAR